VLSIHSPISVTIAVSVWAGVTLAPAPTVRAAGAMVRRNDPGAHQIGNSLECKIESGPGGLSLWAEELKVGAVLGGLGLAPRCPFPA